MIEGAEDHNPDITVPFAAHSYTTHYPGLAEEKLTVASWAGQSWDLLIRC